MLTTTAVEIYSQFFPVFSFLQNNLMTRLNFVLQGVANSSTACLPCYYSCHTCSGPNDYEVTPTLHLLLHLLLLLHHH